MFGVVDSFNFAFECCRRIPETQPARSVGLDEPAGAVDEQFEWLGVRQHTDEW